MIKPNKNFTKCIKITSVFAISQMLGFGLVSGAAYALDSAKNSKISCADQRLVSNADGSIFECTIRYEVAGLIETKRLKKDIAKVKHLRTKSIRQLIKKNHVNGMVISRKYLKAIKKLYKSNGYRPLWSKGNKWNSAARQLRSRLIQANLDGLNPTDYPLLPPSVGVLGASLSDLRLSYGVLRFSEHLMSGRLRPSDILKEHDLKPEHPKFDDVMKALLSTDRPNDVLDALAPPHKAYHVLKDQLGALLNAHDGQYDTALRNKIIANMERWRWMPRELGSPYIWTNLPSYQVRVIKDDKTVFKTKAIIGDVRWPTPLIASRIKNIIMNPSWVLPASVIKREILDIYEDPTEYLAKNNIRLFRRRGREVDPQKVDWKKTKNPRTYVFKQDAGDWNALGQVKILFPNQHSIYLHDTDDKDKFKHDTRAFSHGCIRIDNPIAFSNAIASYDNHLSSQMPSSQLGDREIWLKYKAKMPVYLGYFTLDLDEDGVMQEFGDIYQYDRLIADRLTGTKRAAFNKVLN